MTSEYGRLPNVEIEVEEGGVEIEEKPIEVEEPPKEIFDRGDKKPKKKREMSEDAKQKLRERLAKAREKSLAVRKAKAEEKKKNKKPVGRPKKEKTIPTTTIKLDDNTEISYPTPSKEVIKEVVDTPKPTQPPPPKVKKEIPLEKPQPPIQNHFNIDYDKISNLVVDKILIKNKQEAERLKLKKKQEEEEKQKREDGLRNATRNYFSRLPPVNYVNPNSAWDDCFNPRGRR